MNLFVDFAVDASFGSATGSRTQISWMKTKRTSRYSIAPFIKPIFKDQSVEFHLLNHSTKHIIPYSGFFSNSFLFTIFRNYIHMQNMFSSTWISYCHLLDFMHVMKLHLSLACSFPTSWPIPYLLIREIVTLTVAFAHVVFISFGPSGRNCTYV